MDMKVLFWKTAKKKKKSIHLGCKILSQGSLFLISCVLSVGGLAGAKPIWAMLYFKQMPFCFGDCVFFFLFQVIKSVREKYQMSFCTFLFSFFSLLCVGTFFSSRIFPVLALCSKCGHCPHFLIQWQKLWESNMLLVVQAKRCKWLYWRSMCFCEVLPISKFVLLRWWVLQGGLHLWVSEFEILFFFCVFYHEQKKKKKKG